MRIGMDEHDQIKNTETLVADIFGQNLNQLEDLFGEMDRSELAKIVEHVVENRLPRREWLPLEMRYGLIDGASHTYREIAKACEEKYNLPGLSPGQVRSSIKRGLRRLRLPWILGRRGLRHAVKGSDLYKLPIEDTSYREGMYPDDAVVQFAWGILNVWDGKDPRYWNARNPIKGAPRSVLRWLNLQFFDVYEGEIDRKMFEIHVTRALQCLGPLDFAVMCYRYGFIGPGRRSQVDTGKICGIPGYEVSHIQERCIVWLAEIIRRTMVYELKHRRGLEILSWDNPPWSKSD